MPGNRLYHLDVVDRSGFFQGELTDAVLLSAKWELNGPGEIVYSLPQRSPNVNLPQENINEVQLWIGETSTSSFRAWPDLWCYHSKTIESAKQVTFTCPGVLQYFESFFVWNDTLQIPFVMRDPKHYDTSQDYLNPTYGLPTMYGDPNHVEQQDMLAFLIQYFQDGPDRYRGITVDTYFNNRFSVPAPIGRALLWKREDHQNALEIIQGFTTYTDAVGTPTGVDISIKYQSGGNVGKYFHMDYPAGGGARRLDVLEWGKNLIDYTVNRDGSAMANRLIMTGGTASNVKFEQQTRDDASAAIYGEWQGVSTDGDEKDPPTLLERAQREVATRNAPITTVDVVAVEVPQQLLRVYEVGDWIIVKIDNGRTQIEDYYRIQTIQWLPGPGNLKFGLALR